MAKELDCSFYLSEFELQSHYYVHFQSNTIGKGMDLFILPAINQIVSLLFFTKDGFDFK